MPLGVPWCTNPKTHTVVIHEFFLLIPRTRCIGQMFAEEINPLGQCHCNYLLHHWQFCSHVLFQRINSMGSHGGSDQAMPDQLYCRNFTNWSTVQTEVQQKHANQKLIQEPLTRTTTIWKKRMCTMHRAQTFMNYRIPCLGHELHVVDNHHPCWPRL